MTFTKLGDEFPAEARALSDAAVRTHVEALCWSSSRLLDLLIPKHEVRRFAETADPETAVEELVAAGWWQDCGAAGWYIGCRFAEWQWDRARVEHRRQQVAEAQRRRRAHGRDDHSLCLPKTCRKAKPPPSSDDTPDDDGDDLGWVGLGPNPTTDLEEEEQDPRVSEPFAPDPFDDPAAYVNKFWDQAGPAQTGAST